MRTATRLTLYAWSTAGLLGLGVAAAQEPVVDPPGRVARLSLTEGEVALAPAGSEEWADAVLNRPLTTGDKLWVERGGRAELQVGSATIHLDQITGFGFTDLDDETLRMTLTEGTASVRVRRRAENEVIELYTPNATISLLHPGEYQISVNEIGDRTVVRTRSGESEVASSTQAYRVQANQEGVFTGTDSLVADIGALGPRTAFENWANERDRSDRESESARYVSRDVIGYEDLDDHGTWMQEPRYGYVWRPRTHIVSGWAPYRHGRWVWVGPWGWTWVDHAPWGFAPFHYGRWVHLRNSWCWVPGPKHIRPVYAPALVGWVGSPRAGVSVSFGHGVGWFPLGPREVYIPRYRYSHGYLRNVNVSNTIIVNNTYITNVYRGRGRHVDYRNRHLPHAITAVGRDHFVSGRRVDRDRLRLDDRQLHDWRTRGRAPDIAPVRASVFAGSTRALRDARASRAFGGRGNLPIAPASADGPKQGRGDVVRSQARAFGTRPADARTPRAGSADRPNSVLHSGSSSRRSWPERARGRDQLSIMRSEANRSEASPERSRRSYSGPQPRIRQPSIRQTAPVRQADRPRPSAPVGYAPRSRQPRLGSDAVSPRSSSRSIAPARAQPRSAAPPARASGSMRSFRQPSVNSAKRSQSAAPKRASPAPKSSGSRSQRSLRLRPQ